MSSFALICCDSTSNNEEEEKVKKVMTEFYELQKSGDVASTAELLDESLLNAISENEWGDLLAGIAEYGEIDTFSIMSSDFYEVDGKKYAKIRYKVVHTNKPLFDELILLEGEEGYKIVSYYYATNKDMLGIEDDAQKVATKFYEDCKNGDYHDIVSLMSEKLKKEVSEEQLKSFLERKEKYGKLIKYSNTGDNAHETKEGILCVMDYTVEHEKGLLYEDLELIKINGKFYVNSYEYFTNREKRHAHEDENNNSKEMAEAFFVALENQDPIALEDLLDKDAPSSDKWFELISAKQAFAGALIKHFILDSYHSSKDGNKYYFYDYHTEYENTHLYEQLTLISREEGYKVINYRYNENKEEIFN